MNLYIVEFMLTNCEEAHEIVAAINSTEAEKIVCNRFKNQILLSTIYAERIEFVDGYIVVLKKG